MGTLTLNDDQQETLACFIEDVNVHPDDAEQANLNFRMMCAMLDVQVGTVAEAVGELLENGRLTTASLEHLDPGVRTLLRV
jgi:hypothetical protein